MLILLPSAAYLDAAIGVPVLRVLLAAYGVSFVDLSETRCGRRHLFGRGLGCFDYLKRKFSVSGIKTAELEPGCQYVIGVHPHGILPLGGMAAFLANGPDTFFSLFPHVDCRFLAASFCFYIPGYRDILLAVGAIDASRFSALRALDAGKSLVLLPGGATEALYTNPAQDVLVLSRRTGFVRLALAYGAPLVPVFTFNENNTYELAGAGGPRMARLRGWFQRAFGLSLAVPAHLFPRPTRMACVFGRPIPVEKAENPSDELVAQYLDRYIASLDALYAEHGSLYNIPPTKPPLVIV